LWSAKLEKIPKRGLFEMTKRIVIPVEDERGLEARVAEHFGRAPFFAVVDLDENGKILSTKTEANKGEHHGGTGHPHENLLALKPDVIIACGMGPGGLTSFQNAGATVLKANANTVKDIVASYKQGKLETLATGCEHAHHHTH
jgi:predicted Fe-Mo cluster-binding NifX family protein